MSGNEEEFVEEHLHDLLAEFDSSLEEIPEIEEYENEDQDLD